MFSAQKVFWAFGFQLFVLQLDGFSVGDFGVCENVFSKIKIDHSVSPPIQIKENVTIAECCVGFRTFGSRCIPECQKICVNSFCIGNNKCQCNPDYYAVDDFRCLPICATPCGANMACLAPNKCFCKPEHKRVNESHCEPICSFKLDDDDFECINAKCVSPNKCECHAGFHQVSEFQCEPTCSNCENGDCLYPEVCECKEGFEKNSDETCVPVCDPPCINGNCVGPNVCKCHENSEKYLKSYECLEKQQIKDRESCEKSCQNGACGDNATCVCDVDYEMYNEKCSKKCDLECKNGKCLEDQCICPENYKLSENSTECLPICAFHDEKHDCIYGVCIAPNVCECLPGYRFLDERNCTCVPMCSPMCINGVCTKNGCECHKDFYNISTFECIKNCSEGFKWVYDECMEDDYENIDVFLDSNANSSSEEDFNLDFESTTTTTIESFEETSEKYESSTSADDDNEDEEEDNEGSSNGINETTEREIIVVQKSLHQLLPTKLCIILLSIILVLISLILTTLFFLYRRLNPKNIYYVNQQEKSSNCVYFTRQNVATVETTDVECSL